jgi:hypothetical protein
VPKAGESGYSLYLLAGKKLGDFNGTPLPRWTTASSEPVASQLVRLCEIGPPPFTAGYPSRAARRNARSQVVSRIIMHPLQKFIRREAR